MWFSMGFGTACAVGAYLFRGAGLLLLGAVCLVLTIPGALFVRRWPVLAAVAALLAGVAAGCGVFAAYDAVRLSPARQADGTVQWITLTATDDSWETEYGCAVDGRITLEGQNYRTRLYLDEAWQIEPGDMIVLPAELRFTDEGGGKEPTFHRTNGIALLAYQEDEGTLIPGEESLWYFPARLRRSLETMMDDYFPEDTAPFARALLLGDKTELAYEHELDFRLTGVSHIVSVSGLHMSILFALVYRIGGKRRWLTTLLGIPALLLFAAMAGFTPSVTRAALMQMIMILALLLRREYDPPTALACAVVVMLGMNPLVVASVGFQMSVASVAGIYLFYGRLMKRFCAVLNTAGKTVKARIAKAAASSFSVSLSATVLTVPLAACYFGTVSLVSLIANFLVVPAVSGIFYGIMLTCALGAVLPVLGSVVGWLVSWGIRYVFAVTGLLAELPMAAVYTQSVYIVMWLALVYGLILWVTVFRPGSVSPAIWWGVLGLCVALTASWLEPLLWDYRVTVLDVGQGQCILLQSRGNAFLVDCGGSDDADAGDKAAEALLAMGISRIDGLILTHYDRDHAGGVAYLGQRIGIERLYLPVPEGSEELIPAVLEAADEAEWIWLDTDVEISFGSCSIRIIAPETGKSGNESSAAVLFQNEKYDTLITGDMDAARERELLEKGVLPDLEVLIVGHHGSASSTSAELLYRTAPDIAVISVGAQNPYSHPAQEILDRLELYGCEIYRTDLMGDIVFRG